jgi:hypothetical protein
MQDEKPPGQSPGYALPPPAPWETMRSRTNYFPAALVHELCVRLCVAIPGNIVEFGVASGTSARVFQDTLRRYGSTKAIFGLDSFKGLREPFENAPVGAFASDPPDVPGIALIIGYFEDTCTTELQQQVGRVALAHLDADLHSSTLTALNWLTPLLGTGSLLLFDEFTGGGLAEASAFEQWRRATGIQVVRIAEFDRTPSGWGSVPDRRLLFQVVGSEDLPFQPAHW